MTLSRVVLSFLAALLLLACMVGVSMPQDVDRLPPLDVHAIIDALQASLTGFDTGVVCCPQMPQVLALFSTHMLSVFSSVVHVGITVGCWQGHEAFLTVQAWLSPLAYGCWPLHWCC